VKLETSSPIPANLQTIRERIAHATERSGRQPSDVTLIAVTKTVAPERIKEAIAEGVTHLAENRVQEAQAKFPDRGTPLAADIVMHQASPITLHLVGTLQRNKAPDAAALFDLVHSIDRPEIAAALDRAAAGVRDAPLPVLLQVNLTGEPTKSGVTASDLPGLADAFAACGHLRPSGLMTIARQGANEAELHSTFGTLRRLLEDLRRTHPSGDWRHLSMGMSDDYEIAIQEGATMVRLGRAIFGERRQ
jgi:pyridoxal phosphate enzyme (YggS family)